MNKGQQIQLVLLALVFFCVTEFMSAQLFADTNTLHSSFKYTPPSSSLLIDETLTIHISLKWSGADDRYRFAVPSISAKNLELLRIGQAIEKEGEFVNKEFEYEFKPLQTGSAAIPDFRIPYTCEPGCEAGSVAINGKVFQIILKRKSSALWQILLIIVGISLTLFLIVWKKMTASSRDLTRAPLAQPDTETRAIDGLDKIRQHKEVQKKIDALSKLLGHYERERRFSSNRLSEPRVMNELNDILSALEKLKFSGTRASDAEFEWVLNKTRLFVQKQKIITPS